MFLSVSSFAATAQVGDSSVDFGNKGKKEEID